ncbi:endoglucanase D precursor [Westerdykella ornata]|uniref:Endoglucanase D n=1 Tax=Westerdykella ornata TaxID=318751 RepID=A0A6A6JHP9_WESOR|nr:endoglucanase D precursor [Westerdykella ornata]KAF2275917.1 endoglucanase D precursor [Westerdykella ornata]
MAPRHRKRLLLGAVATALHGVVSAQNGNATSAGVKCPGEFKPLSASDFVENMNPGWNLGNTLDAVQDEGDWNNPKVAPRTFDDAQAAGFNGIRLPVTWAYHFETQAPDWTVDPAWLQRVSDVVDMITQRGFHTIVNVHHDSWIWADVTVPDANITAIEDKFYKLWYQIGVKLACKPSTVAFEPINEPPGTTPEHGAQQNRMNEIFLKAINDAGGWNGQRVVTLAGSGMDSVKTSLWFKAPAELGTRWKNPWALQFHYYSPYDFIFSAWGKTTWGSALDQSSLTTDLTLIRANFTTVPLLIGEWAASPVATEPAARWTYFDFFLRTARSLNMSTVLWDNGADFLNRATHDWRDAVALDILRNTVNGVGRRRNALPLATTDPAATNQTSSAYLYHRRRDGNGVGPVTLPFHFNGNSLVSIAYQDFTLKRGNDYTLDPAAETITFENAFLSSFFWNNPIGSLGNVTLHFSGGAHLEVNILAWDTPTLLLPNNSTSIALPKTGDLADVHIPLRWAGQNRPATVKATRADGKFLVDDWTQWLGPLQQGRMTYSGQWDWDAEGVILKKAVVEEVRRAGVETTFRIEFYPRVEGNWVEVSVVS